MDFYRRESANPLHHVLSLNSWRRADPLMGDARFRSWRNIRLE